MSKKRFLALRIEDLPFMPDHLRMRTARALEGYGIYTAGDLVKYSRTELRSMANVGAETVRMLEYGLIASGLSLNQDPEARIRALTSEIERLTNTLYLEKREKERAYVGWRSEKAERLRLQKALAESDKILFDLGLIGQSNAETMESA